MSPSPQAAADSSLIEAAKREEAWAQKEVMDLISAFARHVHNRAGRDIAKELDAEDLAQEASRRFFTVGIHQYRGQGSEKSFLYSIVKATCIDIWRRVDRRKRLWEGQDPVETETHENPDAKVEVDLILARLDPDARALLQRVYLDGASYAELAAELGLEESSVRAKVSRILRRSRELANPTE